MRGRTNVPVKGIMVDACRKNLIGTERATLA